MSVSVRTKILFCCTTLAHLAWCVATYVLLYTHPAVLCESFSAVIVVLSLVIVVVFGAMGVMMPAAHPSYRIMAESAAICTVFVFGINVGSFILVNAPCTHWTGLMHVYMVVCFAFFYIHCADTE